MANKDNTRAISRIDKRLDALQSNIGSLYQTTYKSRMDDRNDMESIMSSIDDSMDSLITKINSQSASDISNLYLRLQDKNGSTSSKEISKSIEDMFDDNKQIIDTINVDNIRKSIQAEDYQYDLICKYMTKLEDAIDIKKDNVLSSDNFTKDFINAISNKSSKESIDQFADRANMIKEKYHMQELFEEMYYKAAKYGEYFLYHVPYKKAFERLLKRKQIYGTGHIRYESADGIESAPDEVIFESKGFDGNVGNNQKLDSNYLSEMQDNQAKVNLYFDESGIIPEPIDNVLKEQQIMDKHQSVTESYFNESSIKEAVQKGLKMDSDMTSDGFIDSTGKNQKIKDDISGSVMYEIPRDQIFPVALSDDTTIGYIYLQVSNNYIDTMAMNGYTYNSLTNNTRLMGEEFDKQNDMFVSYIASMISDKIDAKFINQNIDLKEQIYAVLRYNDKFNCTNGTNNVTVSFIPASDVHHFYFRLNKKTHRGISDLEKAVVPAMIYCMLYLNNVIGLVSRGQDKRVYYVKQNVETNVAKTLLNVINQIKKGNMGMRQLENMNTIFNVVGRYNDHVIPMNQQGDPPIQMEVLQGQQIDTPTDLMDRMEDQAVSSTDVPLEFVQSTNSVDYATRFTMSNSKFLRKVYKRQSICQTHFSSIFRNAYNFEYKENDTSIKIMLPAPAFLAMTNSQTLVDNTTNYSKALSELVITQDVADRLKVDIDALKAEYVSLSVRRLLGTYVDFGQVDNAIYEAAHKLASNKLPAAEEGSEGEDEY